VSIHNNGPASPVSVDLTVTLSPPFDCTMAPTGSQTASDVILVTSTPVVVTKTWQVTCSNFSFHLFTSTASLTLDPPPTDTNLGNNSGNGQDTTAVSAPTDLKVQGLNVTAPSSVFTGNAFTVSIDIAVHNNGPITPVNAEGGVGLAMPSDCTAAPTDSYQLFNPVTLSTSTTVVVNKSWQVTCSVTGVHQFIACGRVGPVTQHVVDPNISNNFGRFDFVVPVINNAGDEPPTIYVGAACKILGDPPEVCDDGIDNDLDGLIDEEPDTDGDGATDCVDSDDDGDGFADATEGFVGTDPLNRCSVNPSDNAWPPDFDNDRNVSISDVLALKPIFGTSKGDGVYMARYDLSADDEIVISDVLALKPVFGTSCTS
jgi:hypothetical protein